MGIQPPTPSFERSFITALTKDQTVNTSSQVINLNMNTAFKGISRNLGNLQFLQKVAELCDDAHYYFARSFNFPWGSKASSICPVRRALALWGTRVRQLLYLITSKTIICHRLWEKCALFYVSYPGSKRNSDWFVPDHNPLAVHWVIP